MLPEYGLAVFSFDNRTYAGTAAVNATVLDTLVALARLEPRRVPATRILARRMAELKAFLPEWDGARESEIFADNFFLDNRLEDLAARTRELWEAVGPVRSATEVEPWNRLRGTFFVEGERGRIQVLFTLTPEPEPRIQQVVLRLVEP